MLHVLASPRRRRRLGYASLFLAPIVAFAVLVVLRVTRENEPVREVEQTVVINDAPTAEPIRITPEVKRQLGRTIDGFLATAVVRRNLDEAWRLASPALRGSVSRREWERGELPVTPYPAAAIDKTSWKIAYTDAQSVGVDVLVVPKAGADAATLVYAAQLSPAGRGSSRRWLVDYWIPQSSLPTAAAPAEPEKAEKGKPARVETVAEPGADDFDKGQLSPKWFLVPAAILALLLLTPLVIVVRSVVRNRRAERLYREHRR